MRGDVGDVSERDALLGLRGGGARRLGPPGALGHGGALGGGGGGAAGGGDGRHRDGGKRRPLPESPSSGLGLGLGGSALTGAARGRRMMEEPRRGVMEE